MHLPRILLLSTVVMFAGCKPVDGTYYPGCVAFEGDKIVLRDGTVVWDRFTDQIILDADGNEMDRFPDYPKTGRYEVDGALLHLNFDSDDFATTLHIHRSDDRVLLLNDDNMAEWERTGEMNACVLTLSPEEVP